MTDESPLGEGAPETTRRGRSASVPGRADSPAVPIKSRPIRWGVELSDEEWTRLVAEMDARGIRATGKNGLKLIGRTDKPDPQWAAVIEALCEIGAIARADQLEACRSEWVKNFHCPGCGSSSGFARRDVVPGRYDGIRIDCGHKCGTGEIRKILGLTVDDLTWAGKPEPDAGSNERPKPTIHDVGTDPPAESASTYRRVRLTKASEITPRPVRWLWEGRIPVGELSLTPGRGGLGKSTFHGWAIAHLTRGTLPGVYAGTPKPCVIAATEDSWERTIVPRLMAAGAELDRVYRVDVVIDDDPAGITLSLPSDLPVLEQEIQALGVVLLSVDPLLGAIQGRLDTHKDSDVRRALIPLARMADRTGCAVLGNAHFTKGASADAMTLIMGSAGFGNVARAALAFAQDPESEGGECVISQVKNNLGRLDLPSLTYRIDGAVVPTPEGDAEVGRLVVTGESDRSVGDILAEGNNGLGEDRTERAEAKRWLESYLGDSTRGGTAESKDVLKASRADGIAEKTLRRAKADLGVKSEKVGHLWLWTLPEASDSE